MLNITALRAELLQEKRKELLKELINMDIKSRLDEWIDKDLYEKAKKSINVIEDMLHDQPTPLEK